MTTRDWRALLDLGGELAEILDADATAAANHLLGSLHRLTGSDEGFLAFSVRVPSIAEAADPLGGWRPVYTGHDGRAEERTRLVASWVEEPLRLLRDEPTRNLGRSAGTLRVQLRRDAARGVPAAELSANELLEAMDVTDQLCCGVGFAPGFDAIIGLDHLQGSGRFGTRESTMAVMAADSLQWFFRRLARGLDAASPPPHLSPREAATLHQLLAGRTERSIASRFGISVHTVHQYVKSLYRKLGVSHRAELLANARAGSIRDPVADRFVRYDSPEELGLKVSRLA